MRKVLSLLLAALLLFSCFACGNKETNKDDNNGSNNDDSSNAEDSTEPEVTEPEVTEPEETDPPESTTPAPVKKTLEELVSELTLQSGTDLVFEKCCSGDSWNPIKNKWSGPEQEGSAAKENGNRAYAKHRFMESDRSDGTTGNVVTVYSMDAVSGTHVVGNYFGIAEYLQPDTVYQVVASVRYNPGADGFGSTALALFCTNNSTEEEPVYIGATDGWETVTYYFVTGSEIDDSDCLVLGPSDGKALWSDIDYGFKIEIESVALNVFGTWDDLQALDQYKDA